MKKQILCLCILLGGMVLAPLFATAHESTGGIPSGADTLKLAWLSTTVNRPEGEPPVQHSQQVDQQQVEPQQQQAVVPEVAPYVESTASTSFINHELKSLSRSPVVNLKPQSVKAQKPGPLERSLKLLRFPVFLTSGPAYVYTQGFGFNQPLELWDWQVAAVGAFMISTCVRVIHGLVGRRLSKRERKKTIKNTKLKKAKAREAEGQLFQHLLNDYDALQQSYLLGHNVNQLPDSLKMRLGVQKSDARTHGKYLKTYSLVHLALMNNQNTGLLQYVLQITSSASINPHVTDIHGHTPIEMAVEQGHVGALELLLNDFVRRGLRTHGGTGTSGAAGIGGVVQKFLRQWAQSVINFVDESEKQKPAAHNEAHKYKAGAARNPYEEALLQHLMSSIRFYGSKFIEDFLSPHSLKEIKLHFPKIKAKVSDKTIQLRPQTYDQNQDTLLHVAVNQHDLSAANYLVRGYYMEDLIDFQNKNGETPRSILMQRIAGWHNIHQFFKSWLPQNAASDAIDFKLDSLLQKAQQKVMQWGQPVSMSPLSACNELLSE